MLDEITAPPSARSGTPDWKTLARTRFDEWLEATGSLPDETTTTETVSDTDAPDMLSVYKELCVIRNEIRASGRKGSETFSRFGEVLDSLSAAVADTTAVKQRSIENMHVPLAELYSRFLRIAAKFDGTVPGRGIFGGSKKWVDLWNNQREAFRLVQLHLDSLLEAAGMQKIDVLGRPFDPSCMNALEIDTEASVPDNTVVEEIAAGFRVNERIIRYAQVKVHKEKNS